MLSSVWIRLESTTTSLGSETIDEDARCEDEDRKNNLTRPDLIQSRHLVKFSETGWFLYLSLKAHEMKQEKWRKKKMILVWAEKKPNQWSTSHATRINIKVLVANSWLILSVRCD